MKIIVVISKPSPSQNTVCSFLQSLGIQVKPCSNYQEAVDYSTEVAVTGIVMLSEGKDDVQQVNSHPEVKIPLAFWQVLGLEDSPDGENVTSFTSSDSLGKFEQWCNSLPQ